MIYRFMFVAYSKDVHRVKLVPNDKVYAALSCNHDELYLYVESNEETVDPNQLVEGELIIYPDGKKWERAIEIFHYSWPVSEAQWCRKGKKTPYVRRNLVKPEKTASYIFYHYQYQEEVPGDGDRYGSIYLFGQELIFYAEKPTEKETQVLEGALNTKKSPLDRWGTLMAEHFADQWREIKTLEFSEYISF